MKSQNQTTKQNAFIVENILSMKKATVMGGIVMLRRLKKALSGLTGMLAAKVNSLINLMRGEEREV